MKSVRKKIVILSGKGGVGKSTFTTALGWALASDEDLQVGERGSAWWKYELRGICDRRESWMWISADPQYL